MIALPEARSPLGRDLASASATTLSGRSGHELDARSRAGEARVGSQQRCLACGGKLDVQGVDKSQLVASGPGPGQQACQRLTDDRCESEPAQSSRNDRGVDFSGAVQPAKRGKCFCVDVRRSMYFAAPQSLTDSDPELRAEQRFDERRGVENDGLRHRTRRGLRRLR